MEITFDTESFAKALKEVRGLMGFGLRATATLIEISHATLSRLENQSMPDALTLAKCCYFLNVPIDTFIIKKSNKKK